MSVEREPIPIYAQGFFYVHRSGLVDHIVIYDYWDPERYYESVLNDPEKYEEEVETLMENMQYFMDREKVLINGKEAPVHVTGVEIGLRGRPELPYIVFLMEFRGELRKGLNIYENYYEEEEVDYGYIVYWFFPENTRVVKAELGVPYYVEADGRVLFFRVKPQTRVGGREAIYFRIEE